jgi:hypothetical protein
MATVLDEIIRFPKFLDKQRADGGLNGSRVKHYVEKFNNIFELGDCFVTDLIEHPQQGKMNPSGSYYIADGMHRLVAYGLWSQLKPEKFPIAVYLCTNIEI